MAFETISLFDDLEMDDTQHRVASRRALALAHTRVDQRFGAFFRGAQSEEEFLERLGLLSEDFAHVVESAASEMGYDHPEHIASSLKDHYRLATGVAFGPTPEEEEDEEAKKEASRKFALDLPGTLMDQGASQLDSSLFGQQQHQQPQQPVAPGGTGPMNGAGATPQTGGQAQQVAPQHPQQMQQPQQPAVPGQQPDMNQQQALQALQQQPHQPMFAKKHAWAVSLVEGKQSLPLAPKQADNNPSDQDDNSSHKVTCPSCGGDGNTSNGRPCGKCHGSGKVPNFGDSLLDAFGDTTSSTKLQWRVAEEQGNTGLGGPEPKFDKGHGHGTLPKTEDSNSRWPTKEKDIVEPIKAVNGDKLTEIGESTTKHEKLPAAADSDTGFYDGGETKGPHTRTFPDRNQAKPVTRDALN